MFRAHTPIIRNTRC